MSNLEVTGSVWVDGPRLYINTTYHFILGAWPSLDSGIFEGFENPSLTDIEEQPTVVWRKLT